MTIESIDWGEDIPDRIHQALERATHLVAAPLVQVHAINADQQVLGHVRSLEEWITGQQGLGAPDSLSDNFFRLDRILFQSWNAPARGRGDHYIDGSHRFRAPSRAGQQ